MKGSEDYMWHEEMFWEKASAEDVKRRLNEGADPNARFEGRHTPLHYAVMYGHPDTIKVLLALGPGQIDIDARNKNDFAALRMAKMLGKAEAVDALLEAGVGGGGRFQG